MIDQSKGYSRTNPSYMLECRLSPDSGTLALHIVVPGDSAHLSMDDELHFFDLKRGAELGTVKCNQDYYHYAFAYALSPDGSKLALLQDDRIALYETENGSDARSALAKHTARGFDANLVGIRFVRYSADGRRLEGWRKGEL